MPANGLPSFGDMSSMALWPVLMNWQLISSLFPTVRCLSSQVDFQDVLRRFLQTWPGFLLAGTIFFVLFLHLLYNTWKKASSFILKGWSTHCSISEHSVHYQRLKGWLSNHPASQSLTSFTAPENDNDAAQAKAGISFEDDQGLLDINHLMLKAELAWNPDVNKIHFWIGSAYIWFEEKSEERHNFWGDKVGNKSLEVYCFSWNRNSETIKHLLATVKRDQIIKSASETTVYHPKMSPGYYSRNGWRWNVLRKRKKRPLQTVIMDRVQMSTVVNDITSFLSRQGVQWYKEKGLPLRLGFLFHGPPGTGKSSFAFALAGTFGLPVYMLNLSLKSLSDSAVEELFSSLPFHCIIMLEDIDATKPLQRDTAPKTEKGDASDTSSDTEPKTDGRNSLVTELDPRNQEADDKETAPKVTLSGLLNAIDGIGASEGRILIMSTNKVECLDEALIRAGRADRIVYFTNTTKEQAYDMFVAAYTGTRWQPHIMSKRITLEDNDVEDYTDEDIAQLATEFSDKIRNEEFSPALLQQYFKDFRAEPRLAVSELENWMQDPRAYRKPARFSSIKQSPKTDAHAGGRTKLLAVKETVVVKTESAVEDLMSLDDLGGYEEPACFDREFEEKAMGPHGPLLDVS